MLKMSKGKKIGILVFLGLAGLLVFLIVKKNEIIVLGKGNIFGESRNQDLKKVSSIAGQKCERINARPFAVMISSDAEARPLSGIGEADMVFEMPVVENGFTRMMAVYQCGKPKEIGSVRSARLDFVPLALGINAIYAHFGGEHTVLEELDDGVIDNVDGLKYDGTIYYRKKEIPRPHNAFTNMDLLTEISRERNYGLIDSFEGYLHIKKDESLGTNQPPAIFNKPFEVIWKYSQSTNSYLRIRSGKPEIDKNTDKQVEAKNVVIMRTTWSPINKDYIRVKTIGSGAAEVYQNGQKISGSWQKKDDKSKLYFYDQEGKEIKFVPGNIWVEIVTD
jgi:hypothetical protein